MPSGAEAPPLGIVGMYGLKPVPFKLQAEYAPGAEAPPFGIVGCTG
jgi:hypothetical protein